MRKRTRTALAVPALSLAAALAVAGPAAAADTTQGELSPVPLNGADASGTAMVWVDGTTLTVEFEAEGLLADSPHAAHIHYAGAARHECPAASDDADGDGTITTTEGGPAYGSVQVSLTTEGDTSPDSALAVDRFDAASGGDITYQRGSIEVTQEVADALADGEAAVVVHGVDYDGDGMYGGDKMSDLDPSLPAEATDPALCGIMTVSQMAEMPEGGVQTGSGSTAGVENVGLIAGGAAALIAGGALLVRTRRSARAER
ncbi:CHRD domain-containing protein [Cellulosimicrobium arenosum]|uniref:CHRD domain-containing protein n=1 Tax=Cellulosimicrobium arenosum TaxID=2708133 RepID=A0A927G9D7_9MICO|nr:CHRD domain-containing protein [Cellulosimicrobium arenosum]MBD8079055.1 CHRD domain-containing protein [Cellulosimicrobium arenosum]